MIDEQEIENIEKDAKKEIESEEEIKQKLINNDRKIVNKKEKNGEILLGDLGSFKKAKEEDIEEVFEKLNGTIFQLKTCLFKVSNMDKEKKNFTAELINI